MQRNVRKLLAGLALGLMLATPSFAAPLIQIDLFDTKQEYEGFVSAVQTNHFFVISSDNQVHRVMLKPEDHMPELFAGTKVKVVVRPDDSGELYLVKLENLTPINPGATTQETGPFLKLEIK